MRVCLMVEGQEDVTWDDWVALASAAERHGFEALFRSDHYLSPSHPERGALDAWATLAALAPLTESLRLGTLVSPVTFRHPAVLAKMALTVDHVSGGRVELGLGAGWMAQEHELFGFAFPPLRRRMDMLEEQLQTVALHLGGGRIHPPPVQPGGPPIVMGGNAGPRACGLAARFADEYNTVGASADECRTRRDAISAACEAAGRHPIVFSLMTGFVVGASDDEVRARRARIAEWRGHDDVPEAWIAGTPEQAVEQLRALEGAGVERIMLQHHLHTDLEVLELIGREVIPHVA